MSNNPDILRPNIDPLTLQYLDALQNQQERKLDEFMNSVSYDVERLEKRVDALADQVEVQSQLDRYSLTKAKVVRLMKHLRIYDKE